MKSKLAHLLTGVTTVLFYKCCYRYLFVKSVQLRILTITLFAAIVLSTNAQSTAPLPITGKVTVANGLPLAGATVKVKGSASGTKTDENGNFNLNAEHGQVLVISFVGYKDQEIQIRSSETMLNIQLVEQDIWLEEVVVSYGTQKNREVTGAIADIDADKLKDQP